MSTPMKIISLPWTIIAMPPNPLGQLSLDPLTKKVLLLDLPKRIMDSGGPFVHLNHGLEIWGTLCYVDSLVEVVGITPLFCGFNCIRRGRRRIDCAIVIMILFISLQILQQFDELLYEDVSYFV